MNGDDELATTAFSPGEPMARDPRYYVLFEPVKIGPLTAPNRFFQVPHADGMGYAMPRGGADARVLAVR